MRTRIVVTQTKPTRRPSSSLARSRSAPVAGAAAAPLSFHHHPQRPVAAAAAAAPVSSAPPEQDVSTSIDTTGTRESGEASFGASDASFADFDALNDTMALLAEHEGGSGVPSVFANSARRSSNSGHIATRLEATAATYSPDFLDRVVDTLVGAPQFFAEMESSFAECDEKDLTMGDSYMYSNNNNNSHNVTTLDDTDATNFDADATQNESANRSTFVDDTNTTGMATVATPLTRTSANVARKASRFTKVVGARNVPCDADASASAFYDDEDTASGTPNAAARVLRRFSTSLSLSTKAKTTKRSDVGDIATNSTTASRGREAEPEACELKSTRSYLVEAGDDVLIHEDTTLTSVVSSTTTQQGISDEGFPTSASAESVNLMSTSPQKSTCTAAPPTTKEVDQSTATGACAPFSPELAALAPANPKNTLAGAIIVSHVEELLNEIYGPPRTEFGEQSSLVRAQLIVDKYRTRPKDLIRVLEKKAAAKKAAEAEASASKNVSDLGATNKNIPSAKSEKAKLDGATNQAPSIQPPQAKPTTTGSASLTRRLRSFGRSASTKLRTRSRSVDRFRRLRSNTFDDSENYSTPEKARGKDSVHTSTPDTVDNDYSDENDCSFSPLSHIGLHRAEI